MCPLQRGHGPRFLVLLAPHAHALIARSGDLPRARLDSGLPEPLDRLPGSTPGLSFSDQFGERFLVSLMAAAMECSSDLGGAIGFCNREPKNGQHFRLANRL